jgi:hypothetical protein
MYLGTKEVEGDMIIIFLLWKMYIGMILNKNNRKEKLEKSYFCYFFYGF